jgi:hypothetical protein
MKGIENRVAAGRIVVSVAALHIAIAGLAGSAWGQPVSGGPTIEAATVPSVPLVRGVDAAVDPTTGNYLVVGGNGVLVGVCVNPQGAPITGPILINADNHGAFPRARYGTGGFLVVWGEEIGAPTELHSRMVNCSGAVGPEQVISGGATAWLESGAAMAFSPTSQQFLVAWKSFPPNARVKVRLVDLTGAGVGGVVDISTAFGRDPGVAWNSATNQFGVSYSGETGPNGSIGFSGFAVVPAANPAAFTRTTFNNIPGGLVTITDVDYNPATGRYVMAWYEVAGGLLARVAELDAAGNLLTTGVASGRVGSYDALSLARNPVTGTFLLVGLNRDNDTVLGLELNSRGFPFNGENTISGSRPARYTRVTTSSNSPTWIATFSTRMFLAMAGVVTTSFASGGGPPGEFGAGGGGTGGGGAPPPPPPAPPPGGCTTLQPGPEWACVNGGWLPPGSGAGAGGSGGCGTVQPGPGWICQNGGWLPPAAGGGSTGGCTTTNPGPGWTCINGGWLPPGSGGGGGTGGCTTMNPGPGWICMNGGWLPPGSGGGGAGGCTTIQPGPEWVCMNGGWLPAGSGGGGTAGGGCPGGPPGAGWVCRNGDWLPPDIAGGCMTIQPGPAWRCVGGDWLPPQD